MGFFSDDTEEIMPVYKPQAHAKPAIGKLTNLMTQDVKLPTRQTAGMSANEQTGQGILADIAAGKSFQDPSTSQYYSGMRNQYKRATDEGVSALRHRQNLGGNFNSGAAVNQESKYRSQMSDQEMSLLGQLYERERARDNEYTRMAAIGQYGGLPRVLEQSGMNSEYQAALQNMLFPYKYQAPIANSLLNYDANIMPQYITEPSMFSQMAAPVAQMVGAFNGASTTNPQTTVSPPAQIVEATNTPSNTTWPAGWGQQPPYQFPTTPGSDNFSLGQGSF